MTDEKIIIPDFSIAGLPSDRVRGLIVEGPLKARWRQRGVVTAGIDGIYPRGLPVGTVIDVRPGEELFHSIRLRPAVDMGQLDLVYLLPRLAVPEEMRDGGPDAGP